MEPSSGPTYLLWTGERLKDCESTAWEETSSDLIVEALKRACYETLGRTEIVMQLWLASLPVHEHYEVQKSEAVKLQQEPVWSAHSRRVECDDMYKRFSRYSSSSPMEIAQNTMPAPPHPCQTQKDQEQQSYVWINTDGQIFRYPIVQILLASPWSMGGLYFPRYLSCDGMVGGARSY